MAEPTVRFDRLVRAMSRRTAGQWLGAGLFATLTGLASPDDTSAATCKPPRRRCQGKCRRVKTDRRHCGRCNRRCQSGFRCQNGRCRKGGGGGRRSQGAARRPFPQQLNYGRSRLSRPQARLNQDVRSY